MKLSPDSNIITKVVKQREQILQVIFPRTYFVKAGIKITKEVFAKENNCTVKTVK